jgi:hypothetical protein
MTCALPGHGKDARSRDTDRLGPVAARRALT